MSNYRSGPHQNWWQSLTGTERFKFMNKFGIKQVTDKAIFNMFSLFVPDNMKEAYK